MAATSPPTTLMVCSLCRFSKAEASRNGTSGGQYLIDQLQSALQAQNLEHRVNLQPLRCMAGCHQPCNVTLAAPGKLTFILSGVSPTEDVEALSAFCQQYTQADGGRVPYGQRPTTIRDTTAFVLPPLPRPEEG
jgi:predicted metal-binding protein